MRRSLIVPAVVFVLCTALSGRAEPPPIAPSPERLVEQLGAPDFAARERATEALRALGPAALPAVRRATTSANPEARRRALQLLPGLLAQIALAPRRVAFEQKPATLAEALDVLKRQTGYAVTAAPPTGEKVRSFEVREGTFWETVERVAERTDRSVVATQKGVQLVSGRTRSPFVVSDGAFRVELNKIHEDRDFNFDEGGTPGKHEHKLTLKFSVLAEPRFIVLAGGPVQFVEATDERDGKLLPAPVNKRKIITFDFEDAIESDIFQSAEGLLNRSPKHGTRLATVSGVIPVRVVVERRRTVVALTGQAEQSFRVGKDVLSIKDAELTGNNMRVSIQVPLDKRGMSTDRWHQRVKVEDLWGVPLKSNGKGSGSSGENHYISIWYRPPQGWFNTTARRIVVEDWVMLEHNVRFTFKDVPLP